MKKFIWILAVIFTVISANQSFAQKPDWFDQQTSKISTIQNPSPTQQKKDQDIELATTWNSDYTILSIYVDHQQKPICSILDSKFTTTKQNTPCSDNYVITFYKGSNENGDFRSISIHHPGYVTELASTLAYVHKKEKPTKLNYKYDGTWDN